MVKQAQINRATQASLWQQLKPDSGFTIAIWLSVLVHLIVLSIKFQPELKKFKDSLPTLEVMLVNSKTKDAPVKADVLAQANLDRGGNTDANRKMKTALPTPNQKVQEVQLEQTAITRSAAQSAKLKAEEAREQKRIEALEKQAQELMTQVKSLQKVPSNPTQNAAAADPDQGQQNTKLKTPLDTQDLIAAAKEIDRLEALIAKEQDEYQKRPKRKFIGARTAEYRFAMYVEAWRQKVERIGNLNYPEAARDQKLYGQLQMTVSIRADGSIESIKIDRSSGKKVLDDAAKRIVQLSAPFSEFPKDIKKDTDILTITRTWTFTQEDALSTE
ncbi:MAG TPA: energy transducer TonB [Methylophilaceae bacterium]|nr:energy transducer TonB [Methylophilaceae bacterium]